MSKLSELEANAEMAIEFMSKTIVVPLDIAKDIVTQLEADNKEMRDRLEEIGKHGARPEGL